MGVFTKGEIPSSMGVFTKGEIPSSMGVSYEFGIELEVRDVELRSQSERSSYGRTPPKGAIVLRTYFTKLRIYELREWKLFLSQRERIGVGTIFFRKNPNRSQMVSPALASSSAASCLLADALPVSGRRILR